MSAGFSQIWLMLACGLWMYSFALLWGLMVCVPALCVVDDHEWLSAKKRIWPPLESLHIAARLRRDRVSCCTCVNAMCIFILSSSTLMFVYVCMPVCQCVCVYVCVCLQQTVNSVQIVSAVVPRLCLCQSRLNLKSCPLPQLCLSSAPPTMLPARWDTSSNLQHLFLHILTILSMLKIPILYGKVVFPLCVFPPRKTSGCGNATTHCQFPVQCLLLIC